MIRVLLFVCILLAIVSPFTIDDEMTIYYVISAVIFFLIDWRKNTKVDRIAIIFVWILSIFACYLSIMAAGFAGDESVNWKLLVYLIILTVITVLDKKINQWFKKEYKK